MAMIPLVIGVISALVAYGTWQSSRQLLRLHDECKARPVVPRKPDVLLERVGSGAWWLRGQRLDSGHVENLGASRAR